MTAGIPTEYRGIVFRSRLEATWARFMDELGWPWRYEPIDLKGYIPDFILPFDCQDILLEVKPEMRLSELAKHTRKIERSGWAHDALIVGVGILGEDDQAFPPIGLLSQRDHYGDGSLAGWDWGRGEIAHCVVCNRTTLRHSFAAWNCVRCGAYQGNAHLIHVDADWLANAWLKSHQANTWRPVAKTQQNPGGKLAENLDRAGKIA